MAEITKQPRLSLQEALDKGNFSKFKSKAEIKRDEKMAPANALFSTDAIEESRRLKDKEEAELDAVRERLRL